MEVKERKQRIKVSVIIPVYGVEAFVGRCVESVMLQTYTDLEVIIVDDKSADGSMGIVEEVVRRYPERNVKILHHEVNKGLPSARNTGLAAATGEYVYHFDGDDYADPDLIADMVAATDGGRVDVVYSDWTLSYETSERYMPQPMVETPGQMLEQILRGRMKYNVWNKLVRRSLYEENDIRFPDGYGMGEDMTMIKTVAVARSVSYVPKAHYHYVKTNAGAMTENVSDKAMAQIEHNVKSATEFLMRGEFADERLCSIFKLSVKYPLLFSNRTEDYKKWRKWFSEANKHIGDRTFSLHTRVLQWIAYKGLSALLKAHQRTYTFIYNLRFK